jgi:Fic family protein
MRGFSGPTYPLPRWEAERDAMPTLSDMMAAEPQASVRAVLGHSRIGYIHPYTDGNGRDKPLEFPPVPECGH